MKMYRLKKSFFERETTQVAVDLLNCVLVRMTDTGTFLKGRIVETEAYLGLKDDCCHSFGDRRTERTKTMYLPGGYVYVYFTYGMYHCFNIVTTREGEPEAVLIRALKPIEGISEMKINRSQQSIKNLTSGPGKLCQAFDICKKLNGESLEGNKLYIEKGKKIPAEKIAVSERVGLSSHQSACYWPLRFYIEDSPFVSVKR